jgi:glycosyltransferase involved in cell wall biosynthesis
MARVIEVILPVLDERDAIPRVLAGLPKGFSPIVVDNGSRDGSAALARSLGARVVEEATRGFGAACHAGLVACRTELVCFMDCDGSFDGADLPRVVAPLLEDRADLVLGARTVAARGAWPVHSRIANRMLAAELRRRCGVRLRDLGPMRAARRDALVALGLRDRRFGWPLEMVLRAAASGWRVDEVDVAYHSRIGQSKVTGTLTGTLRAVRDMHRVARDVATQQRCLAGQAGSELWPPVVK